MRQDGIINADEWRERENMNPLPDGQGKQYLLMAICFLLRKLPKRRGRIKNEHGIESLP